MIITKRYNRERAVEYAKNWALSRNPLFNDYTGIGGNCTNFVSQSLLAGSCVMDYTELFGWYYESDSNRSPSWTGVQFLYEYLVGAGDYPDNTLRQGPYGREVRASQTQIGDVVQLSREGRFYHTLIITGYEPRDILVSAHSDDALDRRLSSYPAEGVRFIHIDGVRLEIRDDDCFTALNEGIALP
jgi:hypothetical protein